VIVGHPPASKAERHKRKVKQASKFLKAFQAQQRAKNKNENKQAPTEPTTQEPTTQEPTTQEPTRQEPITQGETENG